MKHARTTWAFAAVALLLMTEATRAWHEEGHRRIARDGLARTRGHVPDFLADRADAVAEASLDPDVFAWRTVTPQLRAAERPEHYIDLELLGGAELPATRSDFIALCAARGIRPEHVGYLPYAITEWTQRLAFALAEHRRRPGDEAVRRRCVVYAGMLAHYAADAAQPLHTTIHYNGRAGADGKSPRSGIHDKVDDLAGKVKAVPAGATPTPAAPDELFARVTAEIGRSHALVDRVYELEGQLPADGQPLAEGAVTDFAAIRLAVAVAFLSDLYATAWAMSAEVELPTWYDAASPSSPAAIVPAGPSPGAATAPAGPSSGGMFGGSVLWLGLLVVAALVVVVIVALVLVVARRR